MKRANIYDVTVTACRFGRNCMSIPLRVEYGGRSFEVQGERGRYSFKHNGRYYWLQRAGSTWRLLTTP